MLPRGERISRRSRAGDVVGAVEQVGQEGERAAPGQSRLVGGQERGDRIADAGFQGVAGVAAADGIGVDGRTEADLDAAAEPQVGGADDGARHDRDARR